MRKKLGKTMIIALAVVAMFAVIRCSDDAGLTLTAELDEETVTEALELVNTTIPECVSNVSAKKSFDPQAKRVMDKAVAVALAPFLNPRVGLGTYYGTCTMSPGTLSIEQLDHENGVTTLGIDFSDYCTLSSTGAATYIDGGGTVVDHGTPSDYGPIVDKRTGETDGEIDIEGYASEAAYRAGAAKTMEKTVVVKDFTRNYGEPYNYFVGVNPPTEDTPDTASVGEFVLTDELNDIVISGSDISVTVWETIPGSDTTDNVVQIDRLGGSIGEGGTASFETEEGEPLVANYENQLISGSVIMKGKTGEGVITVNGPNTLEIEVNGEDLVSGTALDCSAFNIEDFVYIPFL